MIAYYSKRLNEAEENYWSNDRELLGLVYFLKRYRCYLDGSEFEVVADNQFVHHLVTKKKISRREARWLDLLSEFNIDKITLEKCRLHVLGDAISRIPQPNTVIISNLHIHCARFEHIFSENYKQDKLFSPILQALEGTFPNNEVQTSRLKFILPDFPLVKGLLCYQNLICVPQQNVEDILRLAHDCPLGGHFSFHKTLYRLRKFHWTKKYIDIKRYCEGCFTCQHAKD